MPKKTTTKAVVYARFSPRTKEGECESIETQQEYCRKYCDFHKLDIIGDFEDRAMTGANDNRPGLREALDLVCAEKGVLVVYSLSRMSRSTLDCIKIAAELKDAQSQMCSVTESIDTSSAYGKVFYTLMAALGECERQVISERTSAAMRYHQAHGRRMSSVLPFGWRADPDDPARMLPDEDELHAIEQMKDCREGGYSWQETADCLTEYGYVPRPVVKQFKGKPVKCKGKWYSASVRRILIRVASESA